MPDRFDPRIDILPPAQQEIWPQLARPPRLSFVVRPATLTMIGQLWADSAFACSLIDVNGSMAEAVKVSSYYWMVSGLLGGVIIGIGLYQRRWSWAQAVTLALLAFHPAWTVVPAYGPDCEFQDVEASQLILALISLLLGYQIFRILHLRRKRALPG